MNMEVVDNGMDCDGDVVEICDMKSQLNVFTRAHGSTLFSSGSTVVAAAVYGPIEVKPHKVIIDKASVDVHYHSKTGPSGVGDRLNESIIYEICDSAILTSQYPRTGIIIILQEIQNQGAILSCSINATCLALIHAGICMNYLFAAVTCVINDNGIIMTLPSSVDYKEDQNKKAEIMFVFESTTLKIVTSNTHGVLTDEQYQECIIKCRAVSLKIFEFYREIIKNYTP